MFAEEITTTSRHDLLGTAMTAARVGAAVIANIRDDSDAPYKSAGKRALYARSDREAIAAGRDLSRSCAIARRVRRMGK